MPTYTYTGILQSFGLGSGGPNREGKSYYLTVHEISDSPEHLYDRLLSAHGLPITVTIEVPEAVTGEQARDGLRGVKAMEAALAQEE